MQSPPREVYLASCTLEEVIRQFGSAPTREHVSLSPTKSLTHWTLWGTQDRWVGFGALMHVTARRGRLKALWVLPTERGNGWGREATSLLCDKAMTLGYSEVDQYAIKPAFWLERGWAPLAKPRPNGAQHLLASLPLPRRL